MVLTGGNMSRDEALSLAGRFLEECFPKADFAFVAGSIMRGAGTPSSDIDLVVFHSKLPHAHRQSQIFEKIPFEAFVHDEETFRWFLNTDAEAGLPVLIRMVTEGAVIGPRPLRAEALRRKAEDIYAKGPPPLDREKLDRMRYVISRLLEDLGDERPDAEQMAIGAALYQSLGDFILRSNRQWSGSGKWLPRQVTAFDAALGDDFTRAFEGLFRRGDVEPVQAFANQALAPHGGLLFAGYRADAPANWRS